MSYIYIDHAQCRRIAAKVGAAGEKLRQLCGEHPSDAVLQELCARAEELQRDILAAVEQGERDEQYHFEQVGPSDEMLRRAVEGDL